MVRKSSEDRLGILLWYRLSRFYQQSVKHSNHYLKEYGLSISQFDVLVQVGTFDRLSQQELADKLLVTKGNMTHLLSKMEQLGLIQRTQEWKTKFISLTEKGRELFEKVVPKQEEFQIGQFDALTKEERKQLHTLLKKLQMDMEE
ncbi:MarR family winged helix-turn-helix transcriptional regulator [Mangrovibacillus cuniculi]|uniref:MarR family transcriptional regulator n=1 Tax=Mangrovibacillus cuniculi TaxID=2593652 RepID=A0A7S8C9E3_9BACI|nr:MarR family transcriptional regulator [Mangrovibacillus cuniculi]QPC45716.1 MarR family transcriptional regulator [Mangrovibacillus cuniculi]